MLNTIDDYLQRRIEIIRDINSLRDLANENDATNPGNNWRYSEEYDEFRIPMRDELSKIDEIINAYIQLEHDLMERRDLLNDDYIVDEETRKDRNDRIMRLYESISENRKKLPASLINELNKKYLNELNSATNIETPDFKISKKEDEITNTNELDEIKKELNEIREKIRDAINNNFVGISSDDISSWQNRIAELEKRKKDLTSGTKEINNDNVYFEEAKSIIDKINKLEELSETSDFIESIDIDLEIESLREKLNEIKSKLTSKELEELENYTNKTVKENKKQDNNNEKENNIEVKNNNELNSEKTPDETKVTKKPEPKKVTSVKKWITKNKKVLIAGGIAAISIGTILLVNYLGPAIIAGKMTANQGAWYLPNALQSKLHSTNIDLASDLAKTFGTKFFDKATGVWTFGGAQLGAVAAKASGAVYASLAAMGLGAGMLAKGIKSASPAYKELNTKIKETKDIAILSNIKNEVEARKNELSNSEYNRLNRKLKGLNNTDNNELNNSHEVKKVLHKITDELKKMKDRPDREKLEIHDVLEEEPKLKKKSIEDEKYREIAKNVSNKANESFQEGKNSNPNNDTNFTKTEKFNDLKQGNTLQNHYDDFNKNNNINISFNNKFQSKPELFDWENDEYLTTKRIR